MTWNDVTDTDTFVNKLLEKLQKTKFMHVHQQIKNWQFWGHFLFSYISILREINLNNLHSVTCKGLYSPSLSEYMNSSSQDSVLHGMHGMFLIVIVHFTVQPNYISPIKEEWLQQRVSRCTLLHETNVSVNQLPDSFKSFVWPTMPSISHWNMFTWRSFTRATLVRPVLIWTFKTKYLAVYSEKKYSFGKNSIEKNIELIFF